MLYLKRPIASHNLHVEPGKMPIKSENTIHEPDDQDGEACRQLITNPRYRQYRLQNDGPYFFRSLIWGVYQNRQYTDFVIRVKDSQKEFHVHRAVICPQSQIFEAACRGTFVVRFSPFSFISLAMIPRRKVG